MNRSKLMRATITCDNENTQRVIEHLLSVGSLHTTNSSDLEFRGIDCTDSHLDVVFNVEHTKISIDVTVDEPKPKKKKKVEGDLTLYAARCVETGKLVSDLTNPRRKYWDREVNARSAINSYNNNVNHYGGMNNHGKVELVKFELVEVPVE